MAWLSRGWGLDGEPAVERDLRGFKTILINAVRNSLQS